MPQNARNLLESFELDPFPQPPVIHLQFPVLLCHGYGALASLFKPAPLHEVSMLLRRHGIMAFAPNVEPYARIESRADSWCDLIEDILNRSGCDRINVIAHSMGGLDMRYAISHLGMDRAVSSLTTLATPHHGTSLAELALQTPSALRSKIGAFFDWLGDYIYPDSETDSLGPLDQLTRGYLRDTFNPQNPDADSVSYYSFSSAIGKGTDTPSGNLLAFQNRYIYQREGYNDGFVSVDSSKWCHHIDTFSLSHLEQMKFGMDEERVPLWENCWLQIAKHLQSEGF